MLIGGAWEKVLTGTSSDKARKICEGDCEGVLGRGSAVSRGFEGELSRSGEETEDEEEEEDGDRVGGTSGSGSLGR